MINSNPIGPWLLALFFMLLGSTISLWLEYFFRKRFPRKFKVNLTDVVGKTYRHSEVEIDGKEFKGCTFDGVTFVYRGTGFYGFNGNTFSGSFSIRIDSPAAAGGFNLVKLSEQLGIPIKFGDDERQLKQETAKGKRR